MSEAEEVRIDVCNACDPLLEIPEANLLQCCACGFIHCFGSSCDQITEEDEDDIQTSSWYCRGCQEILVNSPSLSKEGLKKIRGYVTPASGWTDSVVIEDIPEELIAQVSKSSLNRKNGYIMFSEHQVREIMSCRSGSKIFYTAKCSAQMKKQNIYEVVICLKIVDGLVNLKWSTCECVGGADGSCKHVMAVIYTVKDYCMKGLDKFALPTCTGVLQTWHVKKPTSDEPLLLSDVKFVRHDYKKPSKRDLSCCVSHHDPVPCYAKTVEKPKIEKIVTLFDKLGHVPRMTSILKSNGCLPVIEKLTENAELQYELVQGLSNDVPLIVHDKISKFNESQTRLFNLIVGKADSADIEQQTRFQAKNSAWFKHKATRLTSSMMGSFCKMKDIKKATKVFDARKQFFCSASVAHGIREESAAIAKYARVPIGLVVSPAYPFLGASPDRLVKKNDRLVLVEVKCPYRLYKDKKSIKSMAGDPKFYLENSPEGIRLKRTDVYYYQVQGQLNICEIEFCDFVVYVPPNEIVVLEIKRDREFFYAANVAKTDRYLV